MSESPFKVCRIVIFFFYYTFFSLQQISKNCRFIKEVKLWSTPTFTINPGEGNLIRLSSALLFAVYSFSSLLYFIYKHTHRIIKLYLLLIVFVITVFDILPQLKNSVMVMVHNINDITIHIQHYKQDLKYFTSKHKKTTGLDWNIPVGHLFNLDIKLQMSDSRTRHSVCRLCAHADFMPHIS